MARETKEERAKREADARLAYFEEQKETYLQRLMDAMERACRANFELDINGMSFVLYDRDDRAYDKYELEIMFDEENNDALERFTREVTWKEDRLAEDNRKYLVKQSALAKLSAEERELLGL